jgi:hypothetical protein
LFIGTQLVTYTPRGSYYIKCVSLVTSTTHNIHIDQVLFVPSPESLRQCLVS